MKTTSPPFSDVPTFWEKNWRPHLFAPTEKVGTLIDVPTFQKGGDVKFLRKGGDVNRRPHLFWRPHLWRRPHLFLGFWRPHLLVPDFDVPTFYRRPHLLGLGAAGGTIESMLQPQILGQGSGPREPLPPKPRETTWGPEIIRNWLFGFPGSSNKKGFPKTFSISIDLKIGNWEPEIFFLKAMAFH